MVDYYEMLGFAVVNFNISPAVFWAMTSLEFRACNKVWMLNQGIEPENNNVMTKERLVELAKIA